MSTGVWSIFAIVTALVGVGVAVVAVVLAASKGRRPPSGPRCGRCGYNLTGSASNRCPECGALFIEAGVVVHHERASFTRRAAISAMLVLLLLGMLGFVTMIWQRQRAVAARAQAITAQQAAQAAAQRAVQQARKAEAEEEP